MNKCEIDFPDGWILDDRGFITENLQEPMAKFLKMDLEKWREKFIKSGDKPGASNKL